MTDPNAKVPEEHIFQFRDGAQAHNIKDLRAIISKMPDDEFTHHVDELNNDFANWIEFVYKDPALAADLRRVKTRKHTLEVLDAEIGVYENNHLGAEKYQPFAEPIKPTPPPQTMEAHDGEIHHTISAESTRKFIVKEFIYGMVLGIILGAIIIHLLYQGGIIGI